MERPFLPNRIYYFLFSLLGLVYLTGMFVPLMDNDSAHHANIALHMYLTGDYVNLIDYGRDYLDKPHLHFWLAALSYNIFGVTGFAYKFPSLLFTILGTWSTYRLGKTLYNADTGRLAALITASAFAYILANNDVRMDAILTAAIIFSTWQLVEFVLHKKIVSALLAGLGLAIGFSTKGHIGVLVPLAGIFFYILYRKEWKLFLYWKWLAVLASFALFIFPVVYCYYLQYNLHPEKIVRGRDHINGVQFILLGQSIERFQGDSFGGDSKKDYLFFLHSFLWAFAPWSILSYIAIYFRIKNFTRRSEEWLTTAIFLLVLLVVTFSGFKLPHYLNIVFPTTAIIAAWFLLSKSKDAKWTSILYRIHLLVSILLLLFIAALTFWAFPVKQLWVIIGVVLFLSSYFYFLKTNSLSRIQKTVVIPVAAMALSFFLLNSNFYPQLLKYQGGNELAFATGGTVDPQQVYFWKDNYSSSFNFYTQTTRKTFSDSALHAGKQTWLLYDIRDEEKILDSGYTLGKRFSVPDYEITKLDLKFVNPATRQSVCTQLVLAEVSR